MGLFSLEKRRLCRELRVTFQDLKRLHEVGEELYLRNCRDRTQGVALSWKRVDLDGILGRNS